MPLQSTRGGASAKGFGYLAPSGAASIAFISTGANSAAQRFTIESQGSGEFWGNLNSWPAMGYYAAGQASNTTKGYIIGGLDFAGGANGGYNLGQLRFFTYATSGNSTSNASLSDPKVGSMTASGNNNTRGVNMLGTNYSNTLFPIVPIEYWTTATGGSVGSFGSMTGTYGAHGSGACFNNTRILVSSGNKGQFGGGDTPVSTINYVTTATTGNSSFFGNQSRGAMYAAGQSTVASNTKGLFAGNGIPSGNASNIDQVTIATTGDTTNFGNLTTACASRAGGASNPITGLIFTAESAVDKITMASNSNATSWGSIAGYSVPGFALLGSPCNANAGLTL
jgi:hypothetical protein